MDRAAAGEELTGLSARCASARPQEKPIHPLRGQIDPYRAERRSQAAARGQDDEARSRAGDHHRTGGGQEARRFRNGRTPLAHEVVHLHHQNRLRRENRGGIRHPGRAEQPTATHPQLSESARWLHPRHPLAQPRLSRHYCAVLRARRAKANRPPVHRSHPLPQHQQNADLQCPRRSHEGRGLALNLEFLI